MAGCCCSSVSAAASPSLLSSCWAAFASTQVAPIDSISSATSGRTSKARTWAPRLLAAPVAGLAAIGAANSLGAPVRAFDVRPEVAEEIESMGATFVEAKEAQQEVSKDGYAAALTEEQQQAAMG